MTRTSIAALLLGGCFGAGPVPAEPTDATIVFVAPTPDASNVCNTSTYITSVAFGSNNGYAAVYGYEPNNNDTCNSGSTPTAPVDILQFPIDGSSPEGHVVAMAGMSNMSIMPPQLAAGPSGVIAFFNTPGQPVGSTNVVAAGGTPQVLQGSGGYVIGATGLAIATTSAFMGDSDPMSPQYPCCGGANGNPTIPQGSVIPFAPGSGAIQLGTAVSVPVAFGELPSAIASNTMSTFFVSSASGNMLAIDELGSGTLASIPAANGMRPVGLVADDAHVAWALAQDALATPLVPGCQIGYASLTGSGGMSTLFGAQDLSCMGLAIDPQALYFAIVASEQPPGCSGGCQPVLHGVGIGRVDFNGMFSSIAFDIVSASSGPRRVFTTSDDPNDIFVADSLVVAKIPKMAFAGRQDISP